MEASIGHQELEQLAPALQVIVRQFEASVKRLWHESQSNPHLDLAQLEQQARSLSNGCFAVVLQGAVQARRQRAEEGWLLGQQQCKCGQVRS